MAVLAAIEVCHLVAAGCIMLGGGKACERGHPTSKYVEEKYPSLNIEGSETNYDVVVIDVGTCLIKAGFGGAIFPRMIFSPAVHKDPEDGTLTAGDAVFDKPDMENVKNPIEDGVVTDWDAMTKVLEHILDRTKDNKNRKVLLTETTDNTDENRQKACQILFEKFGVGGMYIRNKTSLARMQGRGVRNGVIVDCGESSTWIIPIVGDEIEESIKLKVGGGHLTGYLGYLLNEAGHGFEPNNVDTMWALNAIKRSICEVALNLDEVEEENVDFELPDGNTISIGKERFQCPEALFNPGLIGVEGKGLSKLVAKAIKDLTSRELPEVLAQEMMQNITLSGFGSLFNGLRERLGNDLAEELECDRSAIRVNAFMERELATWKAAAVMGGMPLMDRIWVTRAQYEAEGPSAVLKYDDFDTVNIELPEN